MNFSYFKGKNLTLKRPILLAIILIPALALQAQNYNNIEFIENKGQWNSRVQYKGNVNNGAFFIRSGGFTVLQHNPQDMEVFNAAGHGHTTQGASLRSNATYTVRSHAWNVDFVGASPAMRAVPSKSIATYNNYFVGDPSQWASNCKIFQAVTLENVYPDIDVRYYTHNGTLKYDIIVKPGGNVGRIALKYDGIDKLQVKNKELVISTSLGERKESAPYTYQASAKGTQPVNCKYVIKDNIVRFDVKDYDPKATLVIDPTLIFCSFSGSTADNWGYTATYGPDGAMYGGGIVRESNGWPVSIGAFQTTYQGGSGTGGDAGPNDIGVMKLSSDGSTRIYATYIGGSGNEQPHSLIVDGQGNLIMAGRTNSANYPTTTPGGVIGPGGGYDIAVTKLNATGTGLIGSKRIGGTGDDGANMGPTRPGVNSLQRNYGDDGRSEVNLDGAGNIYVASCSQSTNFPVTAGAFQTVFGGGTQDGVLLKFNPAMSAMTFGSFLGGSANDAAYVIAFAANGNVFVAGGTESTNFPGNHAGTIGAAHNGLVDGYVAEITNTGAAIVRSTFLGTSGFDQVFGIQVDRNGFPYVMGQTTGSWPVINATYSNPGSKQFIAKLQPDLSAYVYSTVFGTASTLPNISPIAFLVDRCENVYVSGWGGPIVQERPTDYYPNAGTTGLPVTADAIDPTTDNIDLYFFVMQRDATAQLYGSFFGQTGGEGDHVDGGTSRFDQNGVIYQAICGNCKFMPGGTGFPTTPGAYATFNPGPNCNLAMVKMAFNLAGVGAEVASEIGGVPMDTAGCVPLQVTFTDQIRNAESYIWDFGDGTPQIGPLPAATGYTQTHTFTTVNTFQVMLIAIDPATCNIRDTSYINIRVGDLRAVVDFNAVKIGPCTAFQYQFNNTSLAPPSRPFTDTSFLWNFGDQSPTVIGGINPVTHTFPAPGTYNVILTLRDTAYCNYPDADTLQLSVDANVDARFNTPPTGCAPYTVTFDNTSIAGQTWQWDFGDGAGFSSTDFEPTHTYAAGTYNIVLVATNPNTCNVTDTARFTITVFDNPVSDFSFSPITPVENTPHTFTNLASPDAIRFKWEFGDGDTLVTTSRSPVQHQYNSTGTFDACLIAYNAAGCFDRECKQVTTLITPVVDVPNAFTPNSGDINSRVMVRGFGIAKMRFIIWNRWGKKVFETGNRFEGWDGKVKGQVQPMDVYAYTLDIEFFDGTKTTKKGDITLIR
jgi:gliding motility-associated-like protein